MRTADSMQAEIMRHSIKLLSVSGLAIVLGGSYSSAQSQNGGSANTAKATALNAQAVADPAKDTSSTNGTTIQSADAFYIPATNLRERDKSALEKLDEITGTDRLDADVVNVETAVHLIGLQAHYSVYCDVDWQALEPLGITRDTKISMHYTKTCNRDTLIEALSHLATPDVHIGFTIMQGRVLISTRDALSKIIQKEPAKIYIPNPTPTQADGEILEQLDKQVDEFYAKLEVQKFLEFMQMALKIKCNVDWKELASAGVTPKSVATVELSHAPASELLARMLMQFSIHEPTLSYTVRDGAVFITTSEKLLPPAKSPKAP